jgi:hypothetical protein
LAVHAPPRQRLTADELALIALLRGCWTAFGALPHLRPSDLDDAAAHLQALHRIVASGATNRANEEPALDGSLLDDEAFWQTQAPCPRP